MIGVKKFFVSILVLLTCLVGSSLIEAADNLSNAKYIGVVIIGDSDFKTGDCYRFARNKLNPNKNPNIVIESSNEVQSKYMEYWASKGFLEEQELTEQDMIAFAGTSGYDKVIFLIPVDFSANDSFIPSKSLLDFLFMGAGVKTKNLSIEFAAVLCNKNEIIQKYNTTEELTDFSNSNGTTKGKGEHKYDLFRQCVRNFGKKLNL